MRLKLSSGPKLFNETLGKTVSLDEARAQVVRSFDAARVAGHAAVDEIFDKVRDDARAQIANLVGDDRIAVDRMSDAFFRKIEASRAVAKIKADAQITSVEACDIAALESNSGLMATRFAVLYGAARQVIERCPAKVVDAETIDIKSKRVGEASCVELHDHNDVPLGSVWTPLGLALAAMRHGPDRHP